jgi:hypothetical protein
MSTTFLPVHQVLPHSYQFRSSKYRYVFCRTTRLVGKDVKITGQDIRDILEGNPREDKPGAAEEVTRCLPELLKLRYWRDHLTELTKRQATIGGNAFSLCTGLTSLLVSFERPSGEKEIP